MKKYVNFLGLILISLIMNACKEQSWVKPLTDDKQAPEPVAEARVVENLSGGAVIKYRLAPNNNALYVKAEYDVGNGRIIYQKASVYNDTLRLDGFVRDGDFDVKLYAVSRAEVESLPITVTVRPTEPPFEYALTSAKLVPDFGGVLIKMANPTRANLAVLLMRRDSTGENRWSEFHTEYSSSDSIIFNVRGMPNLETTLAVTVRDKYQNFSDTTTWTGTPILEEKIDKRLFRTYPLPTDQPDAFGWVMTRLWDDNLTTGFHTPEHPPGGMPQWFTFDLGQHVPLSRFTIFQRLDIYRYSHGNPREFELYGSVNTPSASGEWDEGWINMGSYEVIKPSGQLPGTNSAEDIEAAAKGHDFNFPAGIPPVRYIRFKVVSAWAAGFFHAMELTLYGQNEKK